MDIYDEEVERLTKDPEDIFFSWMDAKPLFSFVKSETGNDENETYGCLTQIRLGSGVAMPLGVYDEALTEEIRADESLPKSSSDIKPEHLSRFAYWQRRIDKMREEHRSTALPE